MLSEQYALRPNKNMLTLYRRHLAGCKHKAKTRERSKCSCPIWCDGQIDGDPAVEK
jgi:hypothetical protein